MRAQGEERRAQVVCDGADEQPALLLQRGLLLDRLLEPIAHDLEGRTHLCDFRHLRCRQGEVQVALRDLACCPAQRLERAHDAPPDLPADEEQREHQRERRRGGRQRIGAHRHEELHGTQLAPSLQDHGLPARLHPGPDVAGAEDRGAGRGQDHGSHAELGELVADGSLPSRVVPAGRTARDLAQDGARRRVLLLGLLLHQRLQHVLLEHVREVVEHHGQGQEDQHPHEQPRADSQRPHLGASSKR